MDNTYLLFTVALLVLRIIITSYCADKAGNLNRSKIGWGIFAFIFPLVALIWIQFMKQINKQKSSQDQSVNSSLTNKIKDVHTETLNSIDEQKYTLLDLKKNNLFSEEEYNEKLKVLNQKQQEIIKTHEEAKLLKEQEQIDLLVNQLIEPIITKLTDLLNTGIITQNEYNQKKEQIFSERKMQIKDIHCRISKRIDFNQLISDWQKTAVRELYIKSNGENIILFNWERNRITSFTKDEFNELSSSEIVKYYYIVLPNNFEPQLIK